VIDLGPWEGLHPKLNGEAESVKWYLVFFIKKKANKFYSTITNNLTPWWITGITDAEGSFNINYNSSQGKITFTFKLTQKYHSSRFLEEMRVYFNCGSIQIDNKKFQTYKFQVGNTKDLINVIIPHFDKYPLQSSKKLDYLDWKKAILLYKETSDKKQVLEIKDKMNESRLYSERWQYLKKISLNLKPEWVQAFIDGEGSFQCGINPNRNKDGFLINNTLEVKQRTSDVKLLESLMPFFGGGGSLSPKPDFKSPEQVDAAPSVTRYKVYSNETITNFFDKYPLYTQKQFDYEDWKKIVVLRANGVHTTEEGLRKVRTIKKGMNSGRTPNNSLILDSGKLKGFNLPGNKKYYHINRNEDKNIKANKDNKVYIILSSLFFGSIIGLLYIIHLITLDNPENSNDNVDASLDKKPNDNIDSSLSENFNNIHTNLSENSTENVKLHKESTESLKPKEFDDSDYDPFSNSSNESINISKPVNKEYVDLNQSAFDHNQQIDISNEIRLTIEKLSNEDGNLFMFENIVIPQNVTDILKEMSIKQNNIEGENNNVEGENNNVEGENNIYNLKLDTNIINALFDENKVKDPSSTQTSAVSYPSTTSSLFEERIRQMDAKNSPETVTTEISNLIRDWKEGTVVTIVTPKNIEQSFESGNSESIGKSSVYIQSDEHKKLYEHLYIHRENIKELNRQLIFQNIKPYDESQKHPLPLPSWFEVPPRPTNLEEIETWEKDNEVRKKWASKFPFLPEHYEQINILKTSSDELGESVLDINKDESKVSVPIDTNKDESKESVPIDTDKNESKENVSLETNKDSSLGLKQSSDRETPVKDIFEEDDLGIDKLFEEDSTTNNDDNDD